MTLEKQAKQLINTMEEMNLESRRLFAFYEALINGNYNEIEEPSEGNPMHPEFGKEHISSSLSTSDIPY